MKPRSNVHALICVSTIPDDLEINFVAVILFFFFFCVKCRAIQIENQTNKKMEIKSHSDAIENGLMCIV